MRNPTVLVLDETEDLSLQVQSVMAGLRPHAEMVWADSFDAVERQTADHGPFDVLIAGPVATKEAGFRQLRQLRALAPETQLILVVDRWRSTSLRDTVRTGALDILRLPLKDDDLLDAIEQALQVGPAMASGPGNGKRDDGRPTPGHGTVIAVVSATGGCGKTFLATNLAYHLQSGSDTQTCLIDLDLQFGELSTALRLRPRYTIHDLVSNDAEGEDLSVRLEQYLERHDSGIRLLSAPAEPAEADGIGAADVARVIEAARSKFDYVIVDTPAALSEPVLVALEQADQIFALATLDLPSVRNLGLMLSTLKKLKVPAERVTLLLNKVEPDVGIDVARVEQYFPQGFSIVIPYGREVNRSLNMGQPVLAYAPRGDVSKTLVAGLARTLPGGSEPAEDATPEKRRRRRPWARRKTA
jgi:pilus assembly protein CpaE